MKKVSYYTVHNAQDCPAIKTIKIVADKADTTYVVVSSKNGIPVDVPRTDFRMDAGILMYKNFVLKPVQFVTIGNLHKNVMDKTCGHHFYVGRGSDVGNPFAMKSNSLQDRDTVCEQYEEWFKQKLADQKDRKFHTYLDIMVTALRNHGQVTLWCYCDPKRCHAETIKKWLLNPNCFVKAEVKPEPAPEPKPEPVMPPRPDKKVKKITVKVFDKKEYLRTESKCEPIQELELIHIYGTSYEKADGTKVKLTSSHIKRHWNVTGANGKEYLFRKVGV